ncbi:MAG TPA: glycine cleavage system protein GcvH [Acidimicrobiia bacterium]|nr:glycine cleavage system protein GcvH [Acidimicrobiia bacterium]
MNVPEHLRYTEEHEWVEVLDDGTVRVGITDYAQDQLGDVVFVELPEPGTEFEKGAMVAEVESTKSVAEIYAPLTGTVAEVNADLVDSPDLVNRDPYGEGWFVTMTPSDGFDPNDLLDAAAYTRLIE